VPHKTIVIVWVAGLLLALAAYAIGPDHFVAATFVLFDGLVAAVQSTLRDLGMRAYDVVRALALGLFAIFFVLSLVATGRGLPARGTLLVVTLLFLFLVWHEGPEATGHWTLAFVLAACAAASVTRRLAATPAALPQWRP
jgi:hypothetical protein